MADIYVPSDTYFNNKNHFKKMEKYGMKACPVDARGGYVPSDKWDKENATETQESINNRFGLATDGDYGVNDSDDY